MPNKPAEVLKEKILRFLEKHPREHFKPRTLARRLNIKGQDEFRRFVSALNELYQARLISRESRKRYSCLNATASQHTVGIVTRLDNGYGMVHTTDGTGRSIKISPTFLGTALDGDIVRIAVFAKPLSTGDNSKKTEQNLEGEVVQIIKRGQNPVIGTLKKSKHFYYVIPDRKKINQDILIPGDKTSGAKPGQRVSAVISSWDSPDVNPEGKIVEIFGPAGDVETEISVISRKFNLPMNFPISVTNETELIPSKIPPDEYKNRVDLRNLTTFTIDPEDAKDFDDAVSLEKLSGGLYRLGVHIADVSYYVREGSKLDKEALKRGTSVYLVNGVIPMLPEKLSNKICSLREGEDRLTYTVFMDINENGIIKNYKILKSVITNKRRFTYEEVQKIIETNKGPFIEIIKEMNRLSKILYRKRIKEGSIDFESAEVKFLFDETGKPADIVKKERLESHRIIEEFMLAANQTIAKHISGKTSRNLPFIYRVHEPPPPDKLSDFIALVEHLGYHINTRGGITPRALQKLLDDVKNTEEENIINEVAIRSMSKAFYSEKNIGHFGLGFAYYTHFTSPIRRYPDLVIHRLLGEYEKPLKKTRREYLNTTLPDICEQSSYTERIAMEAERASIRIMQVEYMKRHIGAQFKAIITGVTAFGLFVEISDYLVEGLVHVRDMEDDFYTFDEKHLVLVGKRRKKRYRLGDKVNVQVIRVDPETQRIDFILQQ